MSQDLVSVLKSLVTTFSEGIKYAHAHKDELCVGGKIVRIFNLAQYTGDDNDMTYLTLDDDVGEMSLMVPNSIFKELDNEYHFKAGMIVLACGKVLDPGGELKKGKMPATLVCWKVEPISSKED